MFKRPIRYVNNNLVFSDIFCGCGGMRLAVEDACRNLGIRSHCVFSCDNDKYVRMTYYNHFKDLPFGDIHNVLPEKIPAHQLLVAGFPCQPFSSAGKQLGLGDERSSVIYPLIKILNIKKPNGFLLENVPGLIQLDKGKVFNRIINSFRRIGYAVSFKSINAIYFTPQNRKRIYIIGISERIPQHEFIASKVLDNFPGERKPVSISQTFFKRNGADGIKIYQGFIYTLTASMAVSGNIPVIYHNRKYRKLTPLECAFLMGFPDDFRFSVSDFQAYKQIGNSVAVPLVSEILKNMIPFIIEPR